MENASVSRPEVYAWVTIFVAVLVWSVVDPKDLATWWLEVIPALIAFVLLAATFTRFPLTRLAYWLILIHAVILMVGGHYTYAEVPPFDWLKEVLGQTRNNYDKVGHLAQGFIPVIFAREILIRRRVVNGARWTHFLAVCICLAFSAFYELIEWAVALMSDEAAESFLGTQGYIWDTQSDMAWALTGAILSLVIFSRIHNWQISKLTAKLSAPN